MPDAVGIDRTVIEEAGLAAKRVIEREYPDAEYATLMIVLPVSRELIRKARWDSRADRAIRESLTAVVDTIKFPE